MKKFLVLASFAAMAAVSGVNAQTEGNFATLNVGGFSTLGDSVSLNPGYGRKSKLSLNNWTAPNMYVGTSGWDVITQTVNTCGTEAPGIKFVQNTFSPAVNLANTLMLLNEDGQLGIGTANPTAKLDVRGTLKVASDASLSNKVSLNAGSGQKSVLSLKNWTAAQTSGTSGWDVVAQSSTTCGTEAPGIKFVQNIFSPGGSSTSNALLIGENGRIGIGTSNPNSRLEVYNTAAAGHLRLSANDVANADQVRIDLDFHVANTNHTLARVASFYENSANNGSGGLRFFTRAAGALTERMRIHSNGYVGIGLPAGKVADEMLTVNGTIHAKRVKVNLAGPLADYVFDKNYKLMDLKDVENYVNEHSHLPEVPSATEVANNGMDLGEMQNKMLQKIEELTLYVIKQQKEIDELKKK
jgi:hypothetical protein